MSPTEYMNSPMPRAEIIVDVVQPGLTVLFCGMAAGPKSARLHMPYVGPNNKFWPTMKALGLVPPEFTPQQFRELAALGIGITDVAKTQSGMDDKIVVTARDVALLRSKVRKHRPKTLAFVGKRSAAYFYGCGTGNLPLGRQPEPWEGTEIFVLSSPSARAHPHWKPESWQALADFLRTPALSPT
jgi:double-stranded uracil-DNA glycosylase